MTAPVRLQLSHNKGFDLQAWSREVNGLEAVNVGRPGAFGNPFSVASAMEVWDCGRLTGQEWAVRWFREWLAAPDELFEPMYVYEGQKAQRDKTVQQIPSLRGKNLACWCKPDSPCHADVLLELANRNIDEAAR